MNYDQQITNLIETIKADKSIIQPWRNKAVARLEESQAFVRMGKTSSNLTPNINAPFTTAGQCICPMEGVWDKACPVHGKLL